MSFNTVFTPLTLQWSNHIIAETLPLQISHTLLPTGNVIPVIPLASSMSTCAQYVGSQAFIPPCPVPLTSLSQPIRIHVPEREIRCVNKELDTYDSNINTHRVEVSAIPQSVPLDHVIPDQEASPTTVQTAPSINLLGSQVEGPTSFVNFDSDSSDNEDVDRILFGEYSYLFTLHEHCILCTNICWTFKDAITMGLDRYYKP